MCRSSRHFELATSRLSTAFGERDDTCEQVMEAEQRTKTKLPRSIQEIASPVVMAEPGPRGPVVPSELRSAILQHGPCRLNGPLAISIENGTRRIFSEKHYLHTSQSCCWLFAAIGNAKTVSHRCVEQPEELRSEDHIT